jgi:hypothetical protein
MATMQAGELMGVSNELSKVRIRDELEEKDTSSGRDMRTYYCRQCKERINVDNGVALWKVLSDSRKEK